MSTELTLSEQLRQQVRQKLKSSPSVQKVEKLLMRVALDRANSKPTGRKTAQTVL
jgi:hypothetical protein